MAEKNGTDHKVFYNPVEIGLFDLGTTQIGKVIPFTSIAGVYIPESKIDLYSAGNIFKTYAIGTGLAIVGTNTAGTSKNIEITLEGADFTTLGNTKLVAKCTFFELGDIEIIFNLEIIKE